jgi:pimeloyl-ACP methyl ester carboxylesterase
MNSEQFGYLSDTNGIPLYAAFHAPAANVPSRAPVLVCPPLFEERKSAYAALRKLTLKLAAAGHPVLRFDHRGSGESGGSSAARRWPHLAEDAAAARQTLARLSGREDVVLLGLRLGATLTLLEAPRLGAKAVIALAPIVSGAAQVRLWKMRSKIRAELTDGESTAGQARSGTARAGGDAGGTVDFDGYDVHPAFFDDVAAIDLLKPPAHLACPALIVQISHRTDPAAESTQLAAALGAQAQLACLRLEPFWDKLDDVDTKPVDDMAVNWVSSYGVQVSGSGERSESNLKPAT